MAEQISYQGYAQAEGFRPIQVSDANVARIGQEGQRIIRGMEEQRKADIQNRTEYLRGLKYKNQLEAGARDRNEQLRRGNVADIQEQKFANIEREIQANYTNQQNLYNSISSLSTSAFKLASDIQEEKYKRDYSKGYYDALANGINPMAVMENDSQRNQLDQAAVAINTKADQLAAMGAPAQAVENIRKMGNPAYEAGRREATAISAGRNWLTWAQGQLQTNSTLQVVVERDNGERVAITPVQASTSSEKYAVLTALSEEYLKGYGLWGEPVVAIGKAIEGIARGNEQIVGEAAQAEIKASQQKRVDEDRDNFADTRSPEFFFKYFNTLTSANGGDRGAARTQILELMFKAKDDNGNPLFSDVERQKILDQTFPGQDKTIGDQYSTQIAELRDEARNIANQQYRQTEATKQREFAQMNDEVRQIIVDKIDSGEWDNSDLEPLAEKFKMMGNEAGLRMLSTYAEFTNENKQDELYAELWEEKAIKGVLTTEEVTSSIGKVSNDVLRKGLELAKSSQAAAVPKTVMDTASDFIKATIKGKVDYDFLNRKGDPTVPLVTADAEALFQREYVRGMSMYEDSAKAQEYALGVVRENFDNPNGRYSVTDTTGKPDQVARTYFKNFDVKSVVPSIDTLRRDLSSNDNALTEMQLIEPAIIENTSKRYKATGRVSLPQRAQDIANQYGGRVTALDVFNAQAKRSGYDQIPLDALEKAQKSVDPEFQRFINYQPNQIRTDISLLGSGMPSIYNNPQITNEQRSALNVLAKYESGAAGYNAVNQIGVAGGRGVLGFSGDFRKMRQHGGKSLTDMTVGEVMALQADNNMSNDEWIASGRLHAVGKYQFIGPTLAAWVQRLGIPPETRFSPEVQDALALAYMKTAGIGPWVGPSDYATPEERAMIERARTQPISFGPSVWRQTSNMNPNLVSRLTGGN